MALELIKRIAKQLVSNLFLRVGQSKGERDERDLIGDSGDLEEIEAEAIGVVKAERLLVKIFSTCTRRRTQCHGVHSAKGGNPPLSRHKAVLSSLDDQRRP